MAKYNYLEAITEDVKEYIENEIDIAEAFEQFDGNIEEFKQDLNDTLWTVDSVTGNASGSYTCNAYQAEEYICHNLELLQEALQEFGCGLEYLEKGAESCDVTIRCYLLLQAIEEAFEELNIAEEFETLEATNGGSCHSTPKDESNLFVLDTVSDIQIEHSRTLQISLILASKYFNEKPEDKNAMLLFSNRYDDMIALLDVIIASNRNLESKIKSLHDTLAHNSTNPQRPN